MNKPLTLYLAFTKAVDHHNKRHDDKRQVLADEIGYVGENAARMFSAALNPASSTGLSDSKKYELLHALDQDAVQVFGNEFFRQFGLKCVPMTTPVHSVSLYTLIDDAQIESDESWAISKRAMRDGVIDAAEIEQMIKEATEARDKYDEVLVLLEKKRLEVEG